MKEKRLTILSRVLRDEETFNSRVSLDNNHRYSNQKSGELH